MRRRPIIDKRQVCKEGALSNALCVCFFCVYLWLFLCLFFGVSGKRTVAASAGSRRQYPGPHITLSHILHISCNILFMLCCSIEHVIFTLSHILLKAPDLFYKEWDPLNSNLVLVKTIPQRGEVVALFAYCYMKKKQSFLVRILLFFKVRVLICSFRSICSPFLDHF